MPALHSEAGRFGYMDIFFLLFFVCLIILSTFLTIKNKESRRCRDGCFTLDPGSEAGMTGGRGNDRGILKVL